MGNYALTSLTADENIVFETKFHWSLYINIWSVVSLGIYPYLHHKFAEFVVTNKRVIIKNGIFNVLASEIPLSRIETVLVKQSFIGLLLNFGDITIVGTGGTQQSIEHIYNPKLFKNYFFQNI
ncbi:MAG: PH domain-containing protein [Bacteroidetes bacterium]|nr:PH domain-containing protein [Bacteroidota bacterium]